MTQNFQTHDYLFYQNLTSEFYENFITSTYFNEIQIFQFDSNFNISSQAHNQFYVQNRFS